MAAQDDCFNVKVLRCLIHAGKKSFKVWSLFLNMFLLKAPSD